MPTIYPSRPLVNYNGTTFKTGTVTDTDVLDTLKELQNKYINAPSEPASIRNDIQTEMQIVQIRAVEKEPAMTLGDLLIAALQQEPDKEDKSMNWNKKAAMGSLLIDIYKAGRALEPLEVENDDLKMLKDLAGKIATIPMMGSLNEALSPEKRKPSV